MYWTEPRNRDSDSQTGCIHHRGLPKAWPVPNLLGFFGLLNKQTYSITHVLLWGSSDVQKGVKENTSSEDGWGALSCFVIFPYDSNSILPWIFELKSTTVSTISSHRLHVCVSEQLVHWAAKPPWAYIAPWGEEGTLLCSKIESLNFTFLKAIQLSFHFLKHSLS